MALTSIFGICGRGRTSIPPPSSVNPRVCDFRKPQQQTTTSSANYIMFHNPRTSRGRNERGSWASKKVCERGRDRERHKILTYLEYRAVSGVFRTIDPPSPSPPSECVLTPHQRRGYTLAGRWRGGGVNISEDARHWIGLLHYNPSRERGVWTSKEIYWSQFSLSDISGNLSSLFYTRLIMSQN